MHSLDKDNLDTAKKGSLKTNPFGESKNVSKIAITKSQL